MKKPLSAFNYFGGKNSPVLQQFILDKLRLSNCYHLVDVFGGSMAISLNLPEAKIRTYNDLNSDIYNFFQVMRRDPEKLMYQLQLSTHSREDYEKLMIDDITDPIEKARAFFIRTVSSFGNTGALKKYNSWSYTVNDSRYKVSQSVARFLSKVEGLEAVINELRHIQVENRDFRKIFSAYDGDKTIFYVDPPYLRETRTGNIRYKHELTTDEHVELCEILNSLQGQYLLSGYDNEIYKNHLQSSSVEKIGGQKTHAKKMAIETLWANYNLRSNQLQFV